MKLFEGINRRGFFGSVAAAAGAISSFAPDARAAEGSVSPGKYDFDTPYNRIGWDDVKWDGAMQQFHASSLVAGMGIADMDFKAAPCIGQALAKRMTHENWGYLTMPKAFPEGVIRWNKQRYGIDINPDLLGIATGVHPGLIASLKTFSPPGSKVLLTTPTYNGFYGDISYCHLTPEESPMKYENGRFAIDFEDFERRISPETKVFILCNPQNPTGNTWSREDLGRIGEICLKHKVVVLSDEIHCDFVTKVGKYTPFSTLENRDVVNNSLTFKAASKSFSLAAMKCAWFFSTNPEYFNAVKANNRADLTTLGMIANQAAYAEGEDWLNQCVSYIDGNHDFVQNYFKTQMSPLIKIPAKAQGTYLTWVDVSGLVDKIGAKQMAEEATQKRASSGSSSGRPMRPITPEAMVQEWLMTNAKVDLNPGTSYGLGGANHMRMNIATSRRTLTAALNSINDACKKA